MTKQEWLPIAALIVAATGKEMTTATAATWLELLKDLPANAVKAGAERAVMEHQFPTLPPVGKVRSLATEFLNGIPDTPDAAFAKVKAAISRFGHPSPDKAREELGERIWAAVQGIGGWLRICDSTEPATLCAQFRDAWLRQCERGKLQGLPEAIRPRIQSPHDDGPSSIGEFIGQAVDAARKQKRIEAQ